MAAFPWITRALNDSITLRRVFTTEWKNHGFVKLQAYIFSDEKGFFLSFVEKFPDQFSFAICIPEGHRFSGWKAFEQELLTATLHRSSSTTSFQSRIKEHSSWKTSEYIPLRQSQHSKSPKSLSWANLSDSLQRFNVNKETQPIVSNKWERVIICNWVNLPGDLETMAITIAKECQFRFIPKLLPFW